MAEYDPTKENKNPVLDWNIDNGDEEEVNNTRQPPPPPPPGAASDPNHDGEGIELTQIDTEQGRSDETTPLLQQGPREQAWDRLTRLYPDASATDLEAYYDPKSKRLKVKMAGAGKASYYLYTDKKRTKVQRLNPKLTDEITRALGQSAEEKLVQNRQEIRETDRRLREAKHQEKY